MSPLSPEDREALRYSTADVIALVEESKSLSLASSWADFVARATKLVAAHGPEIGMAIVRLALRAAGVPV